MRKLLSTATVLGFWVGYAHAQSSVTLYGIASVNVTYSNNSQTAATSAGGKPIGGARVALLDGALTGAQGSRWGIKGVEDLGGGTRAFFALENGFSMSSGASFQGGDEFGRAAYVGLSNTSVGALTLGRQIDLEADFVGPTTLAWTWGYIFTHGNDIDDLDATQHVNNAIKYVSPSFHGVRVAGMLSPGGVAGSVAKNSLWGAAASYTAGPVYLGAAITKMHDPNFSLYGSAANASTTGNNMGSMGSATTPETNPVFAGYASAGSAQIVAAGGSYDFGKTRIGVQYSNIAFQNLGAYAALNPLGYRGSAVFNVAEVNAITYLTPYVRLGFSYSYTHRGSVGGNDGATYHQANAGIEYLLSKATAVYAISAFQQASGTDSYGRVAVASLSGLTPSATNRQVSVLLGMRHLF